MAMNRLCRVSLMAALGLISACILMERATAESSKSRPNKQSGRSAFSAAAVSKTVASVSGSSSGANQSKDIKPARQVSKSAKQLAAQPARKSLPRARVSGGTLMINEDPAEDAPWYTLVDQYGAILRYVDADEAIDLEPHVGQRVQVLEDTGKVLPASQLAVPLAGLANNQIQPTAFQEELTTPTLADSADEAALMPEPEAAYYDDSVDIDFGGCADCGSFGCRGGCAPGARGIVYVRGEYLSWWFDEMEIPALAVRAAVIGPDPNGGGTLIDPNSTAVIFGNQGVLGDNRNGARFTAGIWLDDAGTIGIEGDFIDFDTETLRFMAGTRGNGEPTDFFIFRPFFNTFDPNGFSLPRGPAVEDVDTDLLDGSVTVDIRSDFQTAGLRLRHGCAVCQGAVRAAVVALALAVAVALAIGLVARWGDSPI